MLDVIEQPMCQINNLRLEKRYKSRTIYRKASNYAGLKCVPALSMLSSFSFSKDSVKKCDTHIYCP